MSPISMYEYERKVEGRNNIEPGLLEEIRSGFTALKVIVEKHIHNSGGVAGCNWQDLQSEAPDRMKNVVREMQKSHPSMNYQEMLDALDKYISLYEQNVKKRKTAFIAKTRFVDPDGWKRTECHNKLSAIIDNQSDVKILCDIEQYGLDNAMSFAFATADANDIGNNSAEILANLKAIVSITDLGGRLHPKPSPPSS